MPSSCDCVYIYIWFYMIKLNIHMHIFVDPVFEGYTILYPPTAFCPMAWGHDHRTSGPLPWRQMQSREHPHHLGPGHSSSFWPANMGIGMCISICQHQNRSQFTESNEPHQRINKPKTKLITTTTINSHNLAITYYPLARNLLGSLIWPSTLAA